MDFFLLIGIVLGLVSVIVGMIVKGANVAVLINPAAAIIIFVGVAAAVVNSFPSSDIKRIPKIFGVLLRNKEYDLKTTITDIVDLANKARRDGLLSLEGAIQNLEDPFLKKGLEMVVDGIAAEQIQEIMENEIYGIEDRHRIGASIFKTAGTSSPTLGVLGAVIGLIGALGNLEDVEALGHMISAAFVATLYGIFFGYVLFIPFSARLTLKSEQEVQVMSIIVEGVLAIQAGQSPKSIEKKLYSLIEPNKRAES
ncbi:MULTISPECIES: flagellar motor stator protein MotA [unclassified Enterococcus]|uniref:flagellar motor stator protein MotA n=1 Tax=unclassified Enterococcus TaxID=2608891 RepID=UPI0006B9C2CA|nr:MULTISPECIES: flagellar motor stator protein MotA [unclassified Enterococcus]KPG68825.1 flagellar motor protein MotA [Enterococcus sp. RIT-PI-f]HCE13381.1 flagellar motor protein MotA [Enterococcus sp.]